MRSKYPCLPDLLALADLLDHVIHDWSGLNAGGGRPAAGGPEALPIEFSFMLNGRAPHLLVLRCGQALAEELAEACTGDPGARELAPWALRELTFRVAGQLALRYPWLFRQPSDQLMPVPCGPFQWPSACPARTAALTVAELPLELRLWVLDPDQCLQEADRVSSFEMAWA